MVGVCDIFEEKYPNDGPVSKSTVSKILSKLYEIRSNVKDKSDKSTVANGSQFNRLLGIKINLHCTNPTSYFFYPKPSTRGESSNINTV